MMESSRDGGGNPVAPEGHRGGPSIAFIGIVVVAVLMLIFFLQNGERTTIDFLVFEKITTIRWSIIVAILLGAALDRVVSIWWRRSRKKKND
jgi:uncharacterized integral membrane protein